MQRHTSRLVARLKSFGLRFRRLLGKYPLATPLGVFAASRILVIGSVGAAPLMRHGPGLSSSLALWDGNWYLSAARGYSLIGYVQHPVLGALPGQSNMAFFPVLPLSIRIVAALTGLPALPAGIIVV